MPSSSLVEVEVEVGVEVKVGVDVEVGVEVEVDASLSFRHSLDGAKVGVQAVRWQVHYFFKGGLVAWWLEK